MVFILKAGRAGMPCTHAGCNARNPAWNHLDSLFYDTILKSL